MDTLRHSLARLREQFNDMAPRARMQLVVIPLLVLVGLGLVVYDGAGPDEEALLSGKVFSTEELKNAEEILHKTALHQFRVEGRKILAPKTEAARYNAALNTSETGQSDGIGKEFDKALDSNPWLAGTGTQQADRMDLARAQVLTKMIKAFAYVEDAQLVWFRAKGRSLNSSPKMTALLTVKPRAGNELTSERVQTLRQAVAGGFGMLPADVTVLDVDESDKTALQSRLRQLQSEKETGQRVARLLPMGRGDSDTDAVTVSSQERRETAATATPETPSTFESRLGKAITEWGGPFGLSLFALGAMWMFNRAMKRPARKVAEIEKPIVSQALSGKPVQAIENEGHTELSRPDQLSALVSQDSESAAELTRDDQVAATEELHNLGKTRPPVDCGERDYARDLLEKSPRKEISSSILETFGPTPKAAPFEFLHGASPESLLTFVVEEHAQTIALILSHLPAALSAAVLSRLPSHKQREVVRRIATMEHASPEVVRDVERSLEARMRSSMVPQLEQSGGLSAVAQMLNVSNRLANKAILESLEQESPELVEQIRRQMFEFDDLLQLDDHARQSLMKEVEPAQWALALKGASVQLKALVMGNLSQRASHMLLEEMQYLGPVRVSDVEAAQRLIIDTVRYLEDTGEISVTAGEAERLIA